MKLYHATTPGKAKRYRQTGFIKAPVRGFTTLQAAMLWSMKVHRTVIYEIEADNACKMPDHHNQFGEAWWNDGDIPVDKIKCVISVNQKMTNQWTLGQCVWQQDLGWGQITNLYNNLIVVTGVEGSKFWQTYNLAGHAVDALEPFYRTAAEESHRDRSLALDETLEYRSLFISPEECIEYIKAHQLKRPNPCT